MGLSRILILHSWLMLWSQVKLLPYYFKALHITGILRIARAPDNFLLFCLAWSHIVWVPTDFRLTSAHARRGTIRILAVVLQMKQISMWNDVCIKIISCHHVSKNWLSTKERLGQTDSDGGENHAVIVSLSVSYFNNLFLWMMMENVVINIYIIAGKTFFYLLQRRLGIVQCCSVPGWASADVIIYRRRPVPIWCLTMQKKILKNCPVPRPLSNSPMICKSLKSAAPVLFVTIA